MAGGAERNRGTIDEADLARYDRLGEEWWDPKGPMGQLHKFNPVRVAYIRDTLGRETVKGHLGPEGQPLDGFRILDVGCGGGILSEALANLGADVVGIDPAPNNVDVAARHAVKAGHVIDYRRTTVEALAASGETFDAVCVMEVVEHVRDVSGFLRDCAAMVRPGGLLFGATLNRTLKSYALAIVGAEYVLRWLPRGTHDWQKFVTPDEFKRHLARAGLTPVAEAGITYSPFGNRWHLSLDMGCNYMIVAQRAAGA